MKTLLVSGNWTLQPIMKSISEAYNLIVLYPDNVAALQAQGVKCVGLSSFGQSGMADYAWDVAAHLVQRVPVGEFESRLHLQQSNAMLGWAIRQWAQHILWIEHLKQCKAQCGEIAGLVVHEDVTQYMKVCVQWAKAHGIKSLQVCHGNYGDPTTPTGVGIHDVLNTDYVAAGNWKQGAFFEHIPGVKPEQVRITGFPQWDQWAHIVRDREMARTVLHLPTDKPAIAYLTSWAEGAQKDQWQAQFEATFHALCDVIKRAGWSLVVKVHSAAEQNHLLTKACYAEQAQKEGIHCTITHEFNDAVLQAVDACFSCWPTCMMTEVAMLKLPGAYIGPTSEGYTWPTHMLYNEDRAQMADAIETKIKQILDPEWAKANDADRLRYLYDCNYLADGRAGERVVSLCKELFPC